MFEILFLFGLMGWALGMAWEYLSALDAFPTIIVGIISVPLLCWTDYLATLQRLALERLAAAAADPIPPERFYWDLRKRRLLASLPLLLITAAAAWFIAIKSPAASDVSPPSLIGWATGAIAMLTSARLIAWSVIYVRASHWFNRMAPWAIGACRNALYRFSENPDFLGPGTSPRREKEESMRD